MASWQAHVAAWILRRRIKRRRTVKASIAEMREQLKPRVAFEAPPNVTFTAGSAGGIDGEWLENSNPNGLTLLYLHGGGYYACSAETHRAITAAFAAQGFRVFAPNYRLAPEHPFPAAVLDSCAAWRGLLSSGVAASRLLIAGDSAGAGLALAVMISARDEGLPMPAAAALFSAWTDLAATGASISRNSERCAGFDPSTISPTAARYLDGADPRNPMASPLYADLSGLPALLLHVGSDEVLLDDSTRLAERARAAGVRVELKLWPVVPHAWQIAQRRLPEARQSVREAADFLRDSCRH
jgi:epsilon-lactone hydrolase